MLKVKYIGEDNGLFKVGINFSKGVETPVNSAQYSELKARFSDYFEFIGEKKPRRTNKQIEEDGDKAVKRKPKKKRSKVSRK